MENAELKVKGMHCNSCAELIKDRVSRMHGVAEVKASYADENVKVLFDAGKATRGDIENEITKMGYRVEGGIAPSQAHEAKTEAKTTAQTSLKEGLIYGLTPHIGCIGFIAASVLGVTVAVQLFRPLLMNAWFFYALIALSLVFATVSSALYLRKQGMLSWNGVSRKKGYLATMYGSTMGVNLLLFVFAFPMLANLDTGVFATPTGAVALAGSGNVAAETAGENAQYSIMKLQVNIPCSGHASLITGDLKTIPGVAGVKFESPNYFDVAFDPKQTSKSEILALEVFKTYAATVVSGPSSGGSATATAGLSGIGGTANNGSPPAASGGSAGGSCGGSSGGCGASCGCGG
ncbi:MAG: heavy-metal-associated domain-containing protein [Candidatus Diapherotrites archaeon]